MRLTARGTRLTASGVNLLGHGHLHQVTIFHQLAATCMGHCS